MVSRRGSVLIASREEAQQAELSECLSNAGYSVAVANSAEALLAKLKEHRRQLTHFDLVILDLGEAMERRLAAEGALSVPMPLVVLVKGSSPLSLATTTASGPIVLVRRPVDTRRLQRIVSRLVPTSTAIFPAVRARASS